MPTKPEMYKKFLGHVCLVDGEGIGLITDINDHQLVMKMASASGPVKPKNPDSFDLTFPAITDAQEVLYNYRCLTIATHEKAWKAAFDGKTCIARYVPLDGWHYFTKKPVKKVIETEGLEEL